MGDANYSREVANVSINFFYDPDENADLRIGEKVIIVPNDPSFGGSEFAGIRIGFLPRHIDVYCSRREGSLAVGKTEVERFVVVPELQRLFSESECCVISFEPSVAQESSPPDSASDSSIDSAGDTSWSSQPSARFFMPEDTGESDFQRIAHRFLDTVRLRTPFDRRAAC